MFLFLICFLFLTEVMFMACKDNLCGKIFVKTDHAGYEFDSSYKVFDLCHTINF